MKQFGKILKFELKNYLANKVFIGVTLFLVVAIAGLMFFPQIKQTLEKSEDSIVAVDLPVMLIAGENTDTVQEAFSNAFTNYSVEATDSDLESVKAEIVSGEAECAFIMESLTAYTYYVDNLSMYDENIVIADETLKNVYRMSAMVDEGFSEQKASKILTADIEHKTETLGKDQMKNYFYTYIMIFALYMVILLYGQMVATNVASEKSSRAMELLITSANPVNLMFGKIIASCIAGFTQIIFIFGTAFVCFNLNKPFWDDNGIISSIFDMPLELLMYMLVFFVLGFFIYAFMYGAVGSTASKVEDINTSVMPITLIFIIAFIVVVSALGSNNVDTPLMKACSFIPFTSPMAMFTRIAMSTVPWYEIVISILILLGSVIAVGVLAAKIYRVGVLLYGTPPKISEIIKAIKKA